LFCSDNLKSIPSTAVSIPENKHEKNLLLNALKLTEDHRYLLTECVRQLDNAVSPGGIEKGPDGKPKWKGIKPSDEDIAKYGW